MALSEDDITEFQRLFEEETGQSLTTEEAEEYAEKLIQFVALLISLPKKSDET